MHDIAVGKGFDRHSYQKELLCDWLIKTHECVLSNNL